MRGSSRRLRLCQSQTRGRPTPLPPRSLVDICLASLPPHEESLRFVPPYASQLPGYCAATSFSQIQPHARFVFQDIRLRVRQGKEEQIEITVRGHARMARRCSRCQQAAPGYELEERHYSTVLRTDVKWRRSALPPFGDQNRRYFSTACLRLQILDCRLRLKTSSRSIGSGRGARTGCRIERLFANRQLPDRLAAQPEKQRAC